MSSLTGNKRFELDKKVGYNHKGSFRKKSEKFVGIKLIGFMVSSAAVVEVGKSHSNKRRPFCNKTQQSQNPA